MKRAVDDYADGVNSTITDRHGRDIEHFLLDAFGGSGNDNQIAGRGNTCLTVEVLDDAVIGGEIEFLGDEADGIHHEIGNSNGVYSVNMPENAY